MHGSAWASNSCPGCFSAVPGVQAASEPRHASTFSKALAVLVAELKSIRSPSPSRDPRGIEKLVARSVRGDLQYPRRRRRLMAGNLVAALTL